MNMASCVQVINTQVCLRSTSFLNESNNSHLEKIPNGEVYEQSEMKSAIAEVAQTYGIENWGAGYFGINSQGHLIVHPAEGDPRSVDVKKVVDDLVARRVKLPILL